MRDFGRRALIVALCVPTMVLAGLQPAAGHGPVRLDSGRLSQPVHRVAHEEPVTNASEPATNASTPPQDEHPLISAVRFANAGLETLDRTIQDYSCTLVKRERISGRLNDHEYIFLKVRQRPFSVYMYFLGPDPIKGRECIYVEGRNEGKLIAHEGRGFKAKLGVFRLDPNGLLAMRGQRYPITEVGIRNLTARLVEVAESDLQYGECEVTWYKNTKVDGRKCTCLKVVHPFPRKEFRFHVARVFIDDELQIPIRYESYQWPKKPGGQPVPDEEYTYMNLKINNGFADADFEERNPNYRFR